MPYVWSEAVECGRSGMPMLRPLFLDFGDDPNTRGIEDQYMFGRSILVAPILDERNRRSVYLPEGRWVDYWTKEVLEGGRWIEVQAPLDTLPLYVLAGGMVPHGPLMQYVDERPCDPLTIELYLPGEEGSYEIQDEGGPDVPVSYRREGDSLIIGVGAAPGEIELFVYGEPVAGAMMDGETLDLRLVTNGSGVRFDGTGAREVRLRLGAV